MRWYHIDEIKPGGTARLAERLESMELSAGIADLYWLPVPPALLGAVQREHLALCGSYVMALELFPDALRLELLVRARGILRCECVAYAEPDLVRHMMNYVNELLEELEITV